MKYTNFFLHDHLQTTFSVCTCFIVKIQSMLKEIFGPISLISGIWPWHDTSSRGSDKHAVGSLKAEI